jgi:hypothetical protein
MPRAAHRRAGRLAYNAAAGLGATLARRTADPTDPVLVALVARLKGMKTS